MSPLIIKKLEYGFEAQIESLNPYSGSNDSFTHYIENPKELINFITNYNSFNIEFIFDENQTNFFNKKENLNLNNLINFLKSNKLDKTKNLYVFGPEIEFCKSFLKELNFIENNEFINYFKNYLKNTIENKHFNLDSFTDFVKKYNDKTIIINKKEFNSLSEEYLYNVFINCFNFSIESIDMFYNSKIKNKTELNNKQIFLNTYKEIKNLDSVLKEKEFIKINLTNKKNDNSFDLDKNKKLSKI